MKRKDLKLKLVFQTNGKLKTDSLIVTKFFEFVLKPESLKRFNALVSDPERIVSVETLAEITAWLVEEYTNRPNQQPEA